MREKHGEKDRYSHPKSTSDSDVEWSQDKTAKVLNQSRPLVSEDLQLAEALNQYPELEKVKNKSMAKRKLKSIKKKERKSAIPDIPNNSKKYKIIHGDIVDVSDQIEDNSIDWIITDPPYPREFLPLIDKLGVFANKKLKNNGSLLCLIGQSYLPEIYKILSGYLTYNWTCCYLMPGNATTIWPRKATSGWKPILWFLKKEHRRDTIYDVFKSEKKEKEHHFWGQSESGFKDIIYNFTDPGDIICDPFLGGGTTGVMSIKLNRFFIGIDNDIKAIETSKKRISEVMK
jgi:site-specific DNA-methyltransferase (adenine-specific)